MADDYLVRIGRLIRDARQHRGWTQLQLADALATSQSAVNRIERGNQNISLEMIARIGEALDSEIVSLGYAGPMHLRVVGGRRLSGSIDVKTSKNACVALLCASLLNSGRTILRKVARIEEVYRILEVLASIGVRARWINEGSDLEIVPTARLDLEAMDTEAARRTRSVIMFLGPLHAPHRTVPDPVRRWLRPRHPHRPAAHVGLAATSAWTSPPPAASTTRASTTRCPPRGPSC